MNYTPSPFVTRPYPAPLVKRAKALLNATHAIFAANPAAAVVAQMVLTKYSVHAGQIASEAAALDADPVDLAIGNLCYDLLMGTMGCSTMALATPEGPVLARNMDWFPAEKIAKASCLVPTDCGVNAGFAGMVGVVTGMSDRGFAFALNAVFGGFDMEGYPTMLFLRRVLDDASGYDEAVKMVTRERLMSGALVTIVGTTNDQRTVVERSTVSAVCRPAKDEKPLCTTNHYRAMAEPVECGRYAHLAAHGDRAPALDVLTHSAVMQDITSQHVVMQPSTRRAEMFVPTKLLPDDVEEALTPDDVKRMLFG